MTNESFRVITVDLTSSKQIAVSPLVYDLQGAIELCNKGNAIIRLRAFMGIELPARCLVDIAD